MTRLSDSGRQVGIELDEAFRKRLWTRSKNASYHTEIEMGTGMLFRRESSARDDQRPIRGFTLVELLLVVTIIGVLASLVVPRFVGRSREARMTAARQEIVGSMGVALAMFEQDMGRYPRTEEGLRVLISPPSDGQRSTWRGPYLQSASVPLDPWQREYRYTYPSQLTNQPMLYDLVSAGPDGQFGTDDDITNHNAVSGAQLRAEDMRFSR